MNLEEAEELLFKGYLDSYPDTDDLIKSRSGIYSDTSENRRLGRVGQKYGGSNVEKIKSVKDKAKEKARKILSNIGDGIKIEYSGYSDTNGVSVYYKAYKGDREVKIRVSDHSVTNTSRVNDEIHFKFDSNDFAIKNSISKIKYMLGIKGYKYGKTKIESPSGRIVDGYGYYKE